MTGEVEIEMDKNNIIICWAYVTYNTIMFIYKNVLAAVR